MSRAARAGSRDSVVADSLANDSHDLRRPDRITRRPSRPIGGRGSASGALVAQRMGAGAGAGRRDCLHRRALAELDAGSRPDRGRGAGDRGGAGAAAGIRLAEDRSFGGLGGGWVAGGGFDRRRGRPAGGLVPDAAGGRHAFRTPPRGLGRGAQPAGSGQRGAGASRRRRGAAADRRACRQPGDRRPLHHRARHGGGGDHGQSRARRGVADRRSGPRRSGRRPALSDRFAGCRWPHRAGARGVKARSRPAPDWSRPAGRRRSGRPGQARGGADRGPARRPCRADLSASRRGARLAGARSGPLAARPAGWDAARRDGRSGGPGGARGRASRRRGAECRKVALPGQYEP